MTALPAHQEYISSRGHLKIHCAGGLHLSTDPSNPAGGASSVPNPFTPHAPSSSGPNTPRQGGGGRQLFSNPPPESSASASRRRGSALSGSVPHDISSSSSSSSPRTDGTPNPSSSASGLPGHAAASGNPASQCGHHSPAWRPYKPLGNMTSVLHLRVVLVKENHLTGERTKKLIGKKAKRGALGGANGARDTDDDRDLGGDDDDNNKAGGLSGAGGKASAASGGLASAPDGSTPSNPSASAEKGSGGGALEGGDAGALAGGQFPKPPAQCAVPSLKRVLTLPRSKAFSAFRHADARLHALAASVSCGVQLPAKVRARTAAECAVEGVKVVREAQSLADYQARKTLAYHPVDVRRLAAMLEGRDEVAAADKKADGAQEGINYAEVGSFVFGSGAGNFSRDSGGNTPTAAGSKSPRGGGQTPAAPIAPATPIAASGGGGVNPLPDGEHAVADPVVEKYIFSLLLERAEEGDHLVTGGKRAGSVTAKSSGAGTSPRGSNAAANRLERRIIMDVEANASEAPRAGSGAAGNRRFTNNQRTSDLFSSTSPRSGGGSMTAGASTFQKEVPNPARRQTYLNSDKSEKLWSENLNDAVESIHSTVAAIFRKRHLLESELQHELERVEFDWPERISERNSALHVEPPKNVRATMTRMGVSDSDTNTGGDTESFITRVNTPSNNNKEEDEPVEILVSPRGIRHWHTAMVENKHQADTLREKVVAAHMKKSAWFADTVRQVRDSLKGKPAPLCILEYLMSVREMLVHGYSLDRTIMYLLMGLVLAPADHKVLSVQLMLKRMRETTGSSAEEYLEWLKRKGIQPSAHLIREVKHRQRKKAHRMQMEGGAKGTSSANLRRGLRRKGGGKPGSMATLGESGDDLLGLDDDESSLGQPSVADLGAFGSPSTNLLRGRGGALASSESLMGIGGGGGGGGKGRY